MKKSMFVVGVVAAAFSLVAMTSCELKMGDDGERFATEVIDEIDQDKLENAVPGTPQQTLVSTGWSGFSDSYDLYFFEGEGGENLILSNVFLNGTAQVDLPTTSLTTAGWNDIASPAYKLSNVGSDFYVLYCFTITSGSSSWDNERFVILRAGSSVAGKGTGMTLRGDNYTDYSPGHDGNPNPNNTFTGTDASRTGHRCILAVKMQSGTLHTALFFDQTVYAAASYISKQ